MVPGRSDLSKACGKSLPSRAVGNENAGGPYDRIDRITWAQRKLLHATVYARANGNLVQIYLCFGQCGLCACRLRGEKRRYPGHRGLLRSRCCIERARVGTLRKRDADHQLLALIQVNGHCCRK